MTWNAQLQWLVAATCILPFAAHAQGYLENPVAGGIESGIGLVSGWHCTAKEIRVYINGVDIGKSGVGSIRNDTAAICGQANTGFSLLYNYNKLAPGDHSIAVHADGVLLETRQFKATRSGGVEFLEGVEHEAELLDFPQAGSRTTLRWSQAKQGFVVVGSDVEDANDRRMLDLVGREFVGSAYYAGLSNAGDPAKFLFGLDGDTLLLTRAAFLADTCFFRGSFSFTAPGIGSTGTYYCTDTGAEGTYQASGIQVNGLGVYSGTFTLTPAGGAPSTTEVHAGFPLTDGGTAE